VSKNLIPEIAKMLGVELGEEFEIKGRKGLTYKFIIDELIVCNDNNTETAYISANMTLVSLIRGNSEIIKLPWKPKKGELYYSFGFRNCPKWGVSQQNWGNHPCDYALLDKGWIYRTRAEAEAALPAVAKELGVEYEL
jgi:hypothetical protein